jgi:uncharacterized protein (TIGR02001 family)
MHKSMLALAVTASIAAPAIAAEAPPPVTGNMTIVSDYRFRGISQTYKGPAIQGGIDYAHSSGLYLGNWNSNVASQVYSGGSGIEMDFYGGWKNTWGDLGVDVGTIWYHYPNAEFKGTAGNKKFENNEIYLGGNWKWLSAKIFYSLTPYFGIGDEQAAGGYWLHKDTNAALGAKGSSKGSTYIDFTATYPASDNLSLVAHYGILEVKKYNDLDYKDWKLGATYDLRGWSLGAAYVATNAKKEWYYTGGSQGNRQTGEGTIVLSVGKTF